MRPTYKFKPRQEVLYFWAGREEHFKAVILKYVDFNEKKPDMNHYHIRVLNYKDNNWTMTVPESSLSVLEAPNKLMRDLV